MTRPTNSEIAACLCFWVSAGALVVWLWSVHWALGLFVAGGIGFTWCLLVAIVDAVKDVVADFNEESKS